jgi:hypothetical protein
MVMLSHPMPAPEDVSGAKQCSHIISPISVRSLPSEIWYRMKFTTCCDDRQSQIPIGSLTTDKDSKEPARTIASQDEEFILVGDFMARNIGIRSNYLLFRSHVVVFLELKITERPG